MARPGGSRRHSSPLTNDGAIMTDGALSMGIFAQSIGGGGGYGGFSVAGRFCHVRAAQRPRRGGTRQRLAAPAATSTSPTPGRSLSRARARLASTRNRSAAAAATAGFSGALNFTGGGQSEQHCRRRRQRRRRRRCHGDQHGFDRDAGRRFSRRGGAVDRRRRRQRHFRSGAARRSLDGSALQIGGSINGTQGANGNVIVQVSGGAITHGGRSVLRHSGASHRRRRWQWRAYPCRIR